MLPRTVKFKGGLLQLSIKRILDAFELPDDGVVVAIPDEKGGQIILKFKKDR